MMHYPGGQEQQGWGKSLVPVGCSWGRRDCTVKRLRVATRHSASEPGRACLQTEDGGRLEHEGVLSRPLTGPNLQAPGRLGWRSGSDTAVSIAATQRCCQRNPGGRATKQALLFPAGEFPHFRKLPLRSPWLVSRCLMLPRISLVSLVAPIWCEACVSHG